jgi:hypothetical protein
MAHWDPIGVSGVPEARDEYDEYLGPLAAELDDGAGADAVARYLAGVQSERMGLPATPDQLRDVAGRVVDWHSRETQRTDDRPQ